MRTGLSQPSWDSPLLAGDGHSPRCLFQPGSALAPHGAAASGLLNITNWLLSAASGSAPALPWLGRELFADGGGGGGQQPGSAQSGPCVSPRCSPRGGPMWGATLCCGFMTAGELCARLGGGSCREGCEGWATGMQGECLLRQHSASLVSAPEGPCSPTPFPSLTVQ